MGDELPYRSIHGTPSFLEWLRLRLESDERSTIGADLTPSEQLHSLLETFIVGRELAFNRQFHFVRPGERAVWELKTADLRVFGWFAQKDCFVAVFGDFKDRIVDYSGLIGGYRDEVVRIRRELGGEAFCVWETGVDDVLSVRYRRS